jgi:hypothetical protein
MTEMSYKPDPVAKDELEASIYKWYKSLPEITLPNIDSPDGTFLELNVSELVKFIDAYTTNKIILELRKVEALEGNPTYAMKWLKDRIEALNHRKDSV